MAKVREVKVRFKPSGSPDVVNYKMYYTDAGAILDYSSLFVDLGSPAPEADGFVRVDIAKLGIFTDGRYDIGLVAVDDAGNESAMDKVLDVPFDFVAPDAPTESAVERI